MWASVCEDCPGKPMRNRQGRGIILGAPPLPPQFSGECETAQVLRWYRRNPGTGKLLHPRFSLRSYRVIVGPVKVKVHCSRDRNIAFISADASSGAFLHVRLVPLVERANWVASICISEADVVAGFDLASWELYGPTSRRFQNFTGR